MHACMQVLNRQTDAQTTEDRVYYVSVTRICSTSSNTVHNVVTVIKICVCVRVCVYIYMMYVCIYIYIYTHINHINKQLCI